MGIQFISHRTKCEALIGGKVKSGIKAAVTLLGRDIKSSIGKPGSGREYKRTKTGKVHRASLPGQPPARDSSWLITHTLFKMETVTSGWVASFVNYAPSLEFGTSSIEARPFFVPAIERNRNKIIELIRD